MKICTNPQQDCAHGCHLGIPNGFCIGGWNGSIQVPPCPHWQEPPAQKYFCTSDDGCISLTGRKTCSDCPYGVPDVEPQPNKPISQFAVMGSPKDWCRTCKEPQPMPLIEHTPLPWRACNDGECSCLQIWCKDHPIAEVISGDWGDDYPSIRLVGESSLDLKAEAYMEQCTYGHIPEEVAKANIQFIIKACNNYGPDHDAEVLQAYKERIRRAVGGRALYVPIDQVLQNRIKIIREHDSEYIGTPGELEDELVAACKAAILKELER